MRGLIAIAATALCLACVTAPAHAAVTVSSAQTQNMSCSSGICAPTATDAVLNVSDLENLLASGNVAVTSTGSGIQANDINVVAAFSWTTASTLALDAHQSIAIAGPVSVGGEGGLSVTTNDGGNGGIFSIGKKGNVSFQSVSSQVTINGAPYALVNSVLTLANAIASNPAGAYALASSYDASGDGTYTTSPIQSFFTGRFEGFGNSISNLSIANETSGFFVGLFSANAGTISHLELSHVKIVGTRKGSDCIGALAGSNGGLVFQVSATGTIRARGRSGGAGGLVCGNSSVPGEIGIDRSSAEVRIEGEKSRHYEAGGLVGANAGGIRESFSTGSVTLGSSGVAGGLAGANTDSLIEDSYATGAVSSGLDSQVGGFVGQEENNRDVNQDVKTSYSTGAVSGGASSLVGGFAGKSNKHSFYADAYWDVTTSGTSQATGKGNSHVIVGETTEKLQSGLPSGFDPAIWGEKASLNNGLPYLLNNPPPKM